MDKEAKYSLRALRKLKKPLWPNRTNSTIEVDGEKYTFPI